MSATPQTERGIILRIRPLTESSLIVNWLTAETGRLSTVAKGARQQKSNLRGKIDLFYRGTFSYQPSRRSDLHTLREVVLEETFPGLREELMRLNQAGYAASFLEQTTETETPLPEVFGLLDSFLSIVQKNPPLPHLVFAFEAKMLNWLGLKPDAGESKLTAGARAILDRLTEAPLEGLVALKLSEGQRRELQQFLHGFLIYHLGKLPRGRARAIE